MVNKELKFGSVIHRAPANMQMQVFECRLRSGVRVSLSSRSVVSTFSCVGPDKPTPEPLGTLEIFHNLPACAKVINIISAMLLMLVDFYYKLYSQTQDPASSPVFLFNSTRTSDLWDMDLHLPVSGSTTTLFMIAIILPLSLIGICFVQFTWRNRTCAYFR